MRKHLSKGKSHWEWELAQQKRDSQRTLARYMQNEQAAKKKKSQLE
ncbi:MAG: hypothetical protein II711_02310 [Clostridia bacterium]|nr:hypothetical protein [Clostridia bacterium]